MKKMIEDLSWFFGDPSSESPNAGGLRAGALEPRSTGGTGQPCDGFPEHLAFARRRDREIRGILELVASEPGGLDAVAILRQRFTPLGRAQQKLPGVPELTAVIEGMPETIDAWRLAGSVESTPLGFLKTLTDKHNSPRLARLIEIAQERVNDAMRRYMTHENRRLAQIRERRRGHSDWTPPDISEAAQ